MAGYKVLKTDLWRDTQGKIAALEQDIALATAFVKEIDAGNLDVSVADQISSEVLKTSLVNMRDQMKRYAISERRRAWANEGLAKFVEILRAANNEDRQQLADRIIKNLVTYLNANQGALYALNDDVAEDMFIEMEACYAYDRKKHLHKRIALGEGLVGQVVLERSTMYLRNVPADFIKITSGLGESLPRNVLLVPLKLDEQVYGVVEIASFQMFEDFEISFVERLSESIASSIAAVKGAERTKLLLTETRQLAEQLKSQEEEMRQNLEELSATQEAMQRAMKEVEAKEAYMSQVLNTTQDLIYTVDRQCRLVTWNIAFSDAAARLNVKIEKGRNAFDWAPEERQRLLPLFERALKGDAFETDYDIELGGTLYHFLTVYAPLKSPSGEVIEAAVYARNVTPVVQAQRESARLLKEAQLQSEQLKAQEEELRQNLEELSATQEAIARAMKEVEGKEAYMSQILNTTQDVIYTVDCDFRMMTWNNAFARQAERLNIKIEKGANAFEWAPEERQRLLPLYAKALNGETFEINFDIELGGATHHFLSVYAPLRSPSGEVIEAAVYARNVTAVVHAQQESARLLKEAQLQSEQLKAQEEELRQNIEELAATQEAMASKAHEADAREKYIRGLLDLSQDVIFSVDRSFNLTIWNEAFVRTVKGLGVTPEKGMPAFGWRADAERQHLVDQFKRVFDGETFEIIVESKYDGNTHHFLSTFSPLRAAEGDIIEAVVFGRDITNRPRHEADNGVSARRKPAHG